MHWLTKAGYLTMASPLFFMPMIGYENLTYLDCFVVGLACGVIGQVFIILGRIGNG